MHHQGCCFGKTTVPLTLSTGVKKSPQWNSLITACNFLPPPGTGVPFLALLKKGLFVRNQRVSDLFNNCSWWLWLYFSSNNIISLLQKTHNLCQIKYSIYRLILSLVSTFSQKYYKYIELYVLFMFYYFITSDFLTFCNEYSISNQRLSMFSGKCLSSSVVFLPSNMHTHFPGNINSCSMEQELHQLFAFLPLAALLHAVPARDGWSNFI